MPRSIPVTDTAAIVPDLREQRQLSIPPSFDDSFAITAGLSASETAQAAK
ncbi:MAG: hypothetical protein R3C59_29370 [Planctomycetaceae bacterium]